MSTAYSVPQPAAPNVFLPPPDLIKKRRKLASRELPDSVIREYRESGRPDADLYEQLVERERKLDWITQRKRIELQDGLQKVVKVSFTFLLINVGRGLTMNHTDPTNVARLYLAYGI